MFVQFVLISCFNFIVTILSQAVPLSPCPRTFWYETDGQVWYGIIEVGPPYQRDLVLKVDMDIGINLPTSYVGRLELLGQRSRLIFNIVNRRKIRYQVHFPILDLIPVLTKITFNGEEICSGPRLTDSIVTSINLRHVLNTKLDESENNFNGFERNPIETTSNYYDAYFEDNMRTTSNPLWQSVQHRPKPSKIPTQSNVRNSSYQPNRKSPWEQQSESYQDNLKSTDERENMNQQDADKETRPNPDTFASFTSKPINSVSEYPGVSSDSDRVELSNVCGIPKNVNPLVVGGDSTNRGDWPWLVAIFAKKVSSLNFLCGATLVSKDTIITAAHCMVEKNNRPVKKEEVVVKLGMFNLQDWTDENVKTLAVQQIISHPSYDGGLGLRNDIAILKIRQVSFTNYILPSCLWTDTLDTKAYIGKYGITVGWGRDENGLLASPEPRLVRQKLVTLDECRESNTAFVFLTSNTTFCAGSRDGTGPCNGDSGGGMFLLVDGKWMLRGIVSSSLNDPTSKNICDLSYYIIYTDVAKFVDWINFNL